MDHSHSMLSPARPPTELAEESSAVSNIEASSALSNNQLESSLQPLRESGSGVSDVVVTDEAVYISEVIDGLKHLGGCDFPVKMVK